MESDWKKFRAMAPVWRERYIEKVNARVTRLLADSNKTETERFWEVLELMQSEAKTLRRCLDGHSRSKMWSFMVCMLADGMLTKDDLGQFSEELQGQLSHHVPEE